MFHAHQPNRDDDGCEQPKRAICSRRLPPPSPSPTPAPTGLVELVVTFTAGPLDRRTYAQRCSNFTKGVKVWWAKTASTRLRYHMMSSMTNRPPFTECLRNFPGPGQYQRRLYVSNTTPEEVYDAFRNQATSFAKLTLKPVCSYVPLNVGTANCGNCFASFSVRVNSLPELRFDQTNLYSPLSCFEV